MEKTQICVSCDQPCCRVMNSSGVDELQQWCQRHYDIKTKTFNEILNFKKKKKIKKCL